MIIYGEESEKNALQRVAELMCLAARTAPKGRGVDRIETIIVHDAVEISKLATAMREIAEKHGDSYAFCVRDANAIENSGGPIVIIGTSKGTMGLGVACGYCGFNDCADLTKSGGVCAYVSGDLGIAVGSAASIASQHKADNRVMFSVGKAAINLKLFKNDSEIAYGIPLSASGKNPFFDRKPK